MWGLGLVILATGMMGFGTGIIKLLVQASSPLFAAGVRNMVAGIILLIIANLIPAGRKTFHRSMLPHVIRGSLFRIFIPNLLLYSAISHLPVVRADFFYTLAPFIAYGYSFTFFHEAMTWRKFIGLVLAVCSIIPMCIFAAPNPSIIVSKAIISWPDIAILLAIMCACYGGIDMKQLVTQESELSYVAVNGFDALCGGMLSLIISYFAEGNYTVGNPLLFIQMLLLSVLVTSIISRNLSSFLMKQYSFTFLNLATLATPFFSAVFGWVLLNESVGIELIFSTIIVIAANAVFYSDEAKAQNNF